MSYELRLDQARSLIGDHNLALGGSGNITDVTLPGYIDPGYFITCIKAMGATSEERLSQLRWEDILECLPKEPVKPILLAKALADIFRAGGKYEPKEMAKAPPAKKAAHMSPEELVTAFDPEEYDSQVGKRLATMSRGEPFLVYASGRLVDIQTTLKLLLEVKQGFPGRTDVDIPGRGVVKVYRLGELPENYAEENPLYRNRPLRPDGTCDQTGRNWEGVPRSIRQLVRVAMDIGELKVSLETAHNVMDMVMGEDVWARLRNRYRKAAVQYDNLSQIGSLPPLKIALKQLKGGSEVKNPFREGVKVEFTPQPITKKEERWIQPIWRYTPTKWGYFSPDGGNTWSTWKQG